MPSTKLSDNEIEYLTQNYELLLYEQEQNRISGTISFNVKYEQVSEPAIQDSYEISIDLNSIESLGLPKIFETKGRILKIAANKSVPYHDLHLNNTNGEMCLIIEPKIKERYPNGFELEEYLKHVEEHLYWISYYEKYDKKPWKEQGHGEKGYVELYVEDKEKYGNAVKAYFGNKPRNEFRKLMRNLRKMYKV